MCLELDIDCTSNRPRKKRGPKNRYVQVLRAQLDGNEDDSNTGQHHLSLIAPSEVLDNIIDDWFNWIHPVAPIFHRALFTREIQGGQGSDAKVSKSFLLLVASVCAATYASLRRRRHNYGKVTVTSCLELAERFNIFSSSHTITLERALTMYNFSSAVHHEQGIDAPLTFRLTGESSVCVKYLMQYQLDSMSFMDQQILKRLYWLAFAGQCTGEMHGRRLLVLHHAHEASAALFPLGVCDSALLHDNVESASNGAPGHYVSGLNALSQLFLVWQSSQAISAQTLNNLQSHILRARALDNELPTELVWANQTTDFGFNVQKVNLKVTQLHIRSNLLEQMNTLARHEGFVTTPDAIIHERHLVVENLLHVLYTMPEEVFDANGYSIVPKIRDIGSALLDELRTGEHGRTLQASINLDKLLAKLEILDLRPMSQTPNF
jgi:hypothetical protein